MSLDLLKLNFFFLIKTQALKQMHMQILLKQAFFNEILLIMYQQHHHVLSEQDIYYWEITGIAAYNEPFTI